MDTIRIIGIDPGTTTVGVAIVDVTLEYKIVNIETILIDAKYVNVNNNYTSLYNRLSYIENRIYEIIQTYRPHMVSHENAFLFHMRPGAYGPLSQSILAITNGIYKANPYMYIQGFAPKYIKKIFSDKGTSDKDGMLSYMRGINEITDLINIERISEHEIDAIAIVFTMIDHVQNNDVILLTL